MASSAARRRYLIGLQHLPAEQLCGEGSLRARTGQWVGEGVRVCYPLNGHGWEAAAHLMHLQLTIGGCPSPDDPPRPGGGRRPAAAVGFQIPRLLPVYMPVHNRLLQAGAVAAA